MQVLTWIPDARVEAITRGCTRAGIGSWSWTGVLSAVLRLDADFRVFGPDALVVAGQGLVSRLHAGLPPTGGEAWPSSARSFDPLCVADAAHWRAWLDAQEDASDGVWLVLAKKSVTAPTSLGYQDALEEALCSGWIDGQRRARDDRTYLQRFTPRRARSMWSLRNVDLVATLAGQATAEPPEELLVALAAAPGSGEAFEQLSRAERFQVLHPILTAADEKARAARIARAVARLTRD